MKFKTSISKVTEDDMIVRGEKLSELIKNASFSDTIFLILNKRKPEEKESFIFNAMLVSIIDHGPAVASAATSRFVMSTGNSVNTAIGAGVLALGNLHGGAIEQAMIQLKKVEDVEAFVRDCVENKKIIYGFGHRIHKQEDPRVTVLLKICKENIYTSPFITNAQQIEKELEKQKGKKLVFNIDGFIAAVLCEMGFTPAAGKAFFVIGRTPGLAAHTLEEQGGRVRRFDEAAVEYE